jgi:hypothetical protein
MTAIYIDGQAFFQKDGYSLIVMYGVGNFKGTNYLIYYTYLE